MASPQETAVASAVEAFRKAMIAADKAALEKLLLPELTYGHASSRLETRDELIAALTSGKAGYSTIELTNQTIRVLDRTAIVRHHFLGKRKNGGDDMKLGILLVWLQQADQQWKLAARQAVKLA